MHKKERTMLIGYSLLLALPPPRMAAAIGLRLPVPAVAVVVPDELVPVVVVSG